MVEYLHNCGYVNVSKSNVKNRQMVLKDRWHEVHDLFGGLSAFAWNAVSMRFEVEDEVWADLIQSKPSVTKWRVNNIRHYDLMMELWVADRAIGSGIQAAHQMCRQRVGPRVQVDLNQNMDYIPEEPIYQEYIDPTPPSPPPSVDEYSSGQTQSVPSGGTSSSQGSKRKATTVDVMDAQFVDDQPGWFHKCPWLHKCSFWCNL